MERQADELLATDSALEQIAPLAADLVRFVELRFFTGLTLKEIAGNAGVSERTLKGHWRLAKAFLHEGSRCWSCEGAGRTNHWLGGSALAGGGRAWLSTSCGTPRPPCAPRA